MNPSATGLASSPQSITGFGLKSPKHLRQIQQYTPQQMNLFESLLGGTQPGLQQGLQHLSGLASGNPESFQHLEAPAFADYQKALGQLGSRFSQHGSLDSSAFHNASRGLGTELAQNLQGQRSQLQSNALTQLLGLSGSLLGQRPFEQLIEQKGPGGEGWGMTAGKATAEILPLLIKAIMAAFGGG